MSSLRTAVEGLEELPLGEGDSGKQVITESNLGPREVIPFFVGGSQGNLLRKAGRVIEKEIHTRSL